MIDTQPLEKYINELLKNGNSPPPEGIKEMKEYIKEVYKLKGGSTVEFFESYADNKEGKVVHIEIDNLERKHCELILCDVLRSLKRNKSERIQEVKEEIRRKILKEFNLE